MSIEQHKAIIRRFFQEFNHAAVDELFVAEYVHHDPSLPPDLQHGREAYKQVVRLFLTGFPDLKTTVDGIVAEGDMVACRWTFQGTQQGEMMGLPPTGKRVLGSGMSIHRIVGGKIAEGWFNFDTLGMLQQLGAIPSPGEAAT